MAGYDTWEYTCPDGAIRDILPNLIEVFNLRADGESHVSQLTMIVPEAGTIDLKQFARENWGVDLYRDPLQNLVVTTQCRYGGAYVRLARLSCRSNDTEQIAMHLAGTREAYWVPVMDGVDWETIEQRIRLTQRVAVIRTVLTVAREWIADAIEKAVGHPVESSQSFISGGWDPFDECPEFPWLTHRCWSWLSPAGYTNDFSVESIHENLGLCLNSTEAGSPEWEAVSALEPKLQALFERLR